jgi:ribosome assembly protein 1
VAESSEDKKDDTDQVFVAFARVFSGCVRKGQKLYVLGPKHDPAIALNKVFFIIYKTFSVLHM